jgi:hypothetical protein
MLNETSNDEALEEGLMEYQVTKINLQESLLLSALDGSAEQLFVNYIAMYLSFEDICNLSMVNIFFSSVCRSPTIWSAIYRRDYIMNDLQRLDDTTFTKESYIRSFSDRNLRVKEAKDASNRFQKALMTAALRKRVENALDFIELRMVVPVWCISLFLSIILFCQKIDGLDISFWVCTIPLLISLVYSLVCLSIVKYIYNHRSDSAQSAFHDLWSGFTGPVVLFFKDVIHKSPFMILVSVFIGVLCILQVVFVSIKLSSSTPVAVRYQFAWGLVFLPLWILFAFGCGLPFSRRRIDTGIIGLFLLIIWIPFFVFFVCLTVKLQQTDYNPSKRHHIRLVNMLIPFWIIEAAIMVVSLGFAVVGLYRFVDLYYIWRDAVSSDCCC